MPNWTESVIHISGDPAVLKLIVDSNFDFHTLYPCPFITKETSTEGWYKWCCIHWGTKWPARDVDIDQDDNGLFVRLVTAWSTPHGILAYLTHRYPSLLIVNEWSDECNEVIGMTTYNNGNVVSKSFEPSCYTLEALEAFASTNSWFDYDAYYDEYTANLEYNQDSENGENGEDREDRLTSVNLKVLTDTYTEFRNKMELLYA